MLAVSPAANAQVPLAASKVSSSPQARAAFSFDVLGTIKKVAKYVVKIGQQGMKRINALGNAAAIFLVGRGMDKWYAKRGCSSLYGLSRIWLPAWKPPKKCAMSDKQMLNIIANNS